MSTIGEHIPAKVDGRAPTRTTTSAWIIALSLVIAVLALVAAGTGLFWSGGEAAYSFTSLHGEEVELLGEGIYRNDSAFKGAGNQGADALILALAVPALLVSTLFYSRGSVRGGLVLLGVLCYLLYVYVSLATGTAYNELFLLYVALFSAGFFAFVLLIQELWGRMELFSTVGLPRRALSVFLLVCAALPAYVWLEPIVRSLGSGEPPALLDHNTTLVTEALDVALIVPANLLAAALVWRRNPRGYLLAWVMLAFLVLISMGVALQTAFQVSAGIDFAPAEIYGPITGFLTVGAVAMYFVVRLLRRATITENEPPRRAASAPASPVDITDPAQSSQ